MKNGNLGALKSQRKYFRFRVFLILQKKPSGLFSGVFLRLLVFVSYLLNQLSFRHKNDRLNFSFVEDIHLGHLQILVYSL